MNPNHVIKKMQYLGVELKMTDIVWKPSKEYIKKANITRFMKKYKMEIEENN